MEDEQLLQRSEVHGKIIAGSKMATVSSSPENLLQKLDSLDIRLKQLEEQQRLPSSYFSADLHQSCRQLIHPPTVNFDQQRKSLPSALQEVHFKGTLLDRLRFLENRILQLSYELEKGNNTASSSTKTQNEITLVQPGHDRRQDMCCSHVRPDKSSKELCNGFDELHSRSPKLQVKGSRAGPGSRERKANRWKNEKGPIDDHRIQRRWFAIGC